MTISDVDLSRAVSHALRHEPWLYELELDDEGWASVDQLLGALREEGGDWESVDRAALKRMLTTAAKRRHEIDGDRIRALYGHSVPGRIQRRPATPPPRLFHGTAPETWAVIQVEGLLAMGRQFVHLSVDRETAVMVGRRKCAVPVVLVIDAAAAAAAGTVFHQGNELVWLTDHVPARFVEGAQ
ncbi:RNA 2'-phosphotransferase [Luteipulveratus mongoliensis]|uniref:Probable RNA 2'-phosphotransferase n=1 Tax=Luteipulveratus mongoliensis TaxID=571913 RepID=A0A0K1JFF2_9MICO|nr:RNA 2'-phosphotransferase [Luteipulveratus mongoliensis]AKU15308.1 RNA 2'-phosphotransferase [Luteipulveratus mongoliensis]